MLPCLLEKQVIVPSTHSGPTLATRCPQPKEFGEICKRKVETGEDKWVEASLESGCWQGVEDYVLEHWVEFLRSKLPGWRHMSLHFDGIRIGPAHLVQEALLRDCENHIEAQTGYAVRVRIKRHTTLQQSAEVLSYTAHISVPEVLVQKCVTPSESGADTAHAGLILCNLLKSFSTLESNADKIVGGATYGTWAELVGCSLEPRLELDYADEDGMWLIHSMAGPRQMAIGVHIETPTKARIVTPTGTAFLDVDELMGLLEGAMDRKLFIYFRVGGDFSSAESRLLDVIAT